MLDQIKNIHIVGIKGVAMSNLAIILKKMGKNITGSDVEEEFITDSLLKKNNIEWRVGFNPEECPAETEMIVYSAAHQGINNPQVAEAKKRNLKIISQAELIGEIMKQFKIKIAVAGCHGKTTTSSLLAFALSNLAAKPSYLVGAPEFNNLPGGNFDGKDYFVVEADEYGVNPPLDKTPKFNFLNPDYILCTNIDFDHPDVYNDLEEVKKAFYNFFDGKKLILCADDSELINLSKKLPGQQFVSYGFNSMADLKISKPEIIDNYSVFNITGNGHACSLPEQKMEISIFGEKNVLNAAGVILTLLQLGFPIERIKQSIRDFSGAKRRFELVYSGNNINFFDDYAHHPKEIETTISAARNRFPDSRLVIIFQPHTYSRTQSLLIDFAKSLSLADYSYILPIFPSAREDSGNFHVSSLDIEKNSPKNNIKAVLSKVELIKLLTMNCEPGTVIFTMGAGDVYKLKDDIIEIARRIV